MEGGTEAGADGGVRAENTNGGWSTHPGTWDYRNGFNEENVHYALLSAASVKIRWTCVAHDFNKHGNATEMDSRSLARA